MNKPKSVIYGKIKKSYFIENQNQKREAGIHLIIDFWGGKIIENKDKIKEILWNSAKKSKSRPLRVLIYKFRPQGITGIVLLCESHIAIHTWPEINYVGIDIFTCGRKTDPYKAFDYLKKEFKPQKIKLKEIKRGERNKK